ncbi:YbaB/EbfC family nucleoid-associated protein [Lentzea sp. NPDC059081]|uniref:YbaB/EbfC family nucleoid-associated protein n=1 Tax=Lentzea sp. NPDC059081 TaxID=3346719 RepID=UPI0036BA09FE
MSTPHSEQLEQLMSQYQRQMAEVKETQRKLREISCTATAPRRALTVTVTHGGAVSDIKFPSGAYKRMAPAELASVLLKTITEAQQLARQAAAEVVAPTLPPGMDAQKLFSGEVDIHSLLKPEPELQDVTRDVMDIRE